MNTMQVLLCLAAVLFSVQISVVHGKKKCYVVKNEWTNWDEPTEKNAVVQSVTGKTAADKKAIKAATKLESVSGKCVIGLKSDPTETFFTKQKCAKSFPGGPAINPHFEVETKCGKSTSTSTVGKFNSNEAQKNGGLCLTQKEFDGTDKLKWCIGDKLVEGKLGSLPAKKKDGTVDPKAADFRLQGITITAVAQTTPGADHVLKITTPASKTRPEIRGFIKLEGYPKIIDCLTGTCDYIIPADKLDVSAESKTIDVKYKLGMPKTVGAAASDSEADYYWSPVSAEAFPVVILKNDRTAPVLPTPPTPTCTAGAFVEATGVCPITVKIDGLLEKLQGYKSVKFSAPFDKCEKVSTDGTYTLNSAPLLKPTAKPQSAQITYVLHSAAGCDSAISVTSLAGKASWDNTLFQASVDLAKAVAPKSAKATAAGSKKNMGTGKKKTVVVSVTHEFNVVLTLDTKTDKTKAKFIGLIVDSKQQDGCKKFDPKHKYTFDKVTITRPAKAGATLKPIEEKDIMVQYFSDNTCKDAVKTSEKSPALKYKFEFSTGPSTAAVAGSIFGSLIGLGGSGVSLADELGMANLLDSDANLNLAYGMAGLTTVLLGVNFYAFGLKGNKLPVIVSSLAFLVSMAPIAVHFTSGGGCGSTFPEVAFGSIKATDFSNNAKANVFCEYGAKNKVKFQIVKGAYTCESGEWKATKKFECIRVDDYCPATIESADELYTYEVEENTKLGDTVELKCKVGVPSVPENEAVAKCLSGKKKKDDGVWEIAEFICETDACPISNEAEGLTNIYSGHAAGDTLEQSCGVGHKDESLTSKCTEGEDGALSWEPAPMESCEVNEHYCTMILPTNAQINATNATNATDTENPPPTAIDGEDRAFGVRIGATVQLDCIGGSVKQPEPAMYHATCEAGTNQNGNWTNEFSNCTNADGSAVADSGSMSVAPGILSISLIVGVLSLLAFFA